MGEERRSEIGFDPNLGGRSREIGIYVTRTLMMNDQVTFLQFFFLHYLHT